MPSPDPKVTEKTPMPTPYQPKDVHFYQYATCLLAAALVPSINAQADNEFAEATAAKCAAMLDSGTVPKDFMLRRLRATGEELRVYKIRTEGLVINATNSNIRTQPYGTAGDIESAQKAEIEAAKARGGPLPPIDELREKNAAALAVFTDLTFRDRYVALTASAARLGACQDVTGARELEALWIVAEEIERALRLGKDLKVDAPDDEEEIVAAISDMPWPAAIASSYALALAGADPADVGAEDPRASTTETKA